MDPRRWRATGRMGTVALSVVAASTALMPTAAGAGAGPRSPAGLAADTALASTAAAPADNAFPIPAPYGVSYTDSWHACRDGCRRLHKGNDLMADEGTPIVAVESGVIAKVNPTDTGLGGLSIWLRGESGNTYYYAHESAVFVTARERVTRGQVIGRVGHTGNAATTPSHVHFQINRCGELSSAEPCTVDPYHFLRRWPQELVGGGADAIGWYTPTSSTFRLRTEGGSGPPAARYGRPGSGDVPLAGDWDGDGRDTLAVYRLTDNTFHRRDGTGRNLPLIRWGRPGDQPIVGDWDGDGRDNLGVYRPADATFRLRGDDGKPLAPIRFGTPGAADVQPVAGDWDGDGRDSLGLFRTHDATWLRRADNGKALSPARYGRAGDLPLIGDWDGDGRDTLGVYRPGDSTYRLHGLTDRPLPPTVPADAANGGGRPGTSAGASAPAAAGIGAAAAGTGAGATATGSPDAARATTPRLSIARLAGAAARAAAEVARAVAAGQPVDVATRRLSARIRATAADVRAADAADVRAVDAATAAATSAGPVAAGPVRLGTAHVAGARPVAGDWNGRDLVTLDDLRAIFGPFPTRDASRITKNLPLINAAMIRAGATTPARKAAFLATIHNESGFRADAVETGDAVFRGRGFIQLTGEGNYRRAGADLELDLADDPALAANPLVSPGVAAWYWTVARNVNAAADHLDMAAVNMAVGYRPSAREDTERCGDFVRALRWFVGGTMPRGVNCERSLASKLLALDVIMGLAPGPISTAGTQGGAVGTLPATGIASTSGSTAGSASTSTSPSTTTRHQAAKRTATTKPKPHRSGSTTSTTAGTTTTSPPPSSSTTTTTTSTGATTTTTTAPCPTGTTASTTTTTTSSSTTTTVPCPATTTSTTSTTTTPSSTSAPDPTTSADSTTSAESTTSADSTTAPPPP